jgi:hypothetical protein
MASTIRIKRSGVTGSPTILAQGELAYSYLLGTQSNGGDRLYVGTGTETEGAAANIEVIGGKYFTSKLSHTPGIATANSALILDDNKKLDEISIDNIKIDGNTISSTNTNGNIIFLPNGSGVIDVSSVRITGLGEPSANTDATTKFYVDTQIQDVITLVETTADLDFQADIGSGAVILASETFTIAGGTGLTTTGSGTTVTIDLDNTTVVAGEYGSTTEIPVFTVDAQGRLTAANTVSISTDLSIAGDSGVDTVSLGTDTLEFIGDTGITTTVTDNQVSFNLDDTAVTPNSYGSSDTVATFTVDAQGRLTAASDQQISIVSTQVSDFQEAVEDVVGAILDGDINSGITITYNDTAGTLVVSAEDATTTTKGVASFDTNNFTVTSGAVSSKDFTIGSTVINLGDTTTTLAGLQSLDVDNININGNTISSTDTDGDIILSPNGSGSIDVSSSKITNLSTPTVNTDAATKEYVDTIASASLHYHDPVRVEFPVTLTATYDNGTNGVGATLTNSGTQAALVGDGITLDVGDRVLVYQQANPAHNGIYEVVNAGSVSSNWVLTRASDTNSYYPSSPTALGAGDAFYVKEGVTGSGELYVMTTPGAITFGATNILFSQISSAQIYSAGDGLSLDGVTFNVNVDDSSIEISGDALRVKALGITNAMLAGSIENSKLINSTISVAADTGTTDPVALGETLTFTGGTGISTAVTGNQITINGDDATTSTKGIASFNATDFSVSSGAVSINDEKIEDVVAAYVVGGTAITITYDDDIGGDLTFDANIASTSSLGVASFSATNFAVSVGGEVTVAALDGGTY